MLRRWLRTSWSWLSKGNIIVLSFFVASSVRSKGANCSPGPAPNTPSYLLFPDVISLFCFTDVNEKSKIVAIREWLCIDQRDPESRADRWSRRAFAGEYYLSENAVFSLCLTCKSNFTFEKSVERVCRYCESPYCYCVYVLGKWCRCIGFSLLWLLCRKLFELQQLGYQRYEEKSRSVPVGEMFCSHYTACIWTSQSKTGSYLDLIWR